MNLVKKAVERVATCYPHKPCEMPNTTDLDDRIVAAMYQSNRAPLKALLDDWVKRYLVAWGIDTRNR